MTEVSDRTTSARAAPRSGRRGADPAADGLTWDAIVASMPDGTALIDSAGVMRFVNDALVRMSGYDRDELVGRDVQMLVPERHRDLEGAARRQYSTDAGAALIWSDLDLSMLCAGGVELAVDFAMSPVRVGAESWALAMVRDRSARQTHERARAEAELRARVAFESNMAPMSLTDVADRIIAVNDAFCQMTGFSRDELIGQDSTPFTHPDDVGITETTLARAISGEIEQERYEKRYLRKDGRVIHVQVSRSPVRDADGRILYFVFSERDITDERALTEQLVHRALHDPLTGLANRALFEDRLAQAHARVARVGGVGAVLLLDLDDFKGVNDTHGHFAGDQLLVAMARRLEVATRATDTLCRFGGDEFLYLAEGLEGPAEAEALADRLLEVIGEPVAIGSSPVTQHASVGIVVFDPSDADVGEIIQNVDAALYEAKSHGRGHHVVFTPSMRQRAVNRFSLAQELRGALDSGQLSMYYQPITDLATGVVVGMEALMRWHHPDRGLVLPGVFIPVAEQSDLILELGTFALRAAIAEAAAWEGDLDALPYVTVNLSGRQLLAPDLIPTIRGLLAEAELPPRRLVLEITESVALLDEATTMSVLRDLNRMGVGIALDDFGSGYSALDHLLPLNPRIIKIDQSFVRPDHHDPRSDELLESIISMGQRLNMTMLAEGIEDQVQFHRLRRMGCELGQGYLFSRPVPTPQAGGLVGQVFGD